MNTVWGLLVMITFFNGCIIKQQWWTYAKSQITGNASIPSRPEVINIGSILTLDTIIGKVAKIGLEAAVENVNNDPTILKGTKLKLIVHDSNFSGFLSIMEAFQSLETESVAVIGPQTSVLAHMISHVVNKLQVPLLSFTATDPTLSSLQYPFFVRTTHSDAFQMAAIADIVAYYEWKQVVAIYIDDDHGRNGITFLADELATKRCKISHKAPIKPDARRADIREVLLQIALMESRVIVVHTYANWGLDVLQAAHDLHMMDRGYVWITTNWLSTVIDINSWVNPTKFFSSMQGVITLRSYIKNSPLKRKFATEWKNMTTLGLSTYSLYAYDTIWLLARALDNFFNHGGSVSFSKDPELNDSRGGFLNLDSLRIFNEGNSLLNNILQVKMNGTTGPVEFTSDKNLISPAFEVINVIGTGFRRVGYWSNSSHLSTTLPETVPNRTSSPKLLRNVIWPGETLKKPRGWVFPHNGNQLKIGVPKHVNFKEFVDQVKGTDMYEGYCIDVFTSAVNLLPYAVPYKFYPYGDGYHDPDATHLVSLISAGVYDAVVGDIAIITNRTQMADFTQPYTESGLVVVAPVRRLNSGTWAFLRPFTAKLWCVTGLFFIVVGAIVWILEHRINDEFRGPPKQQIITTLWFSFSTLYFSHKQNMMSSLGRLVLIMWLLVVLIISSSYTASLTSILTVQKLSSPIEGISSLMSIKDPIGYQQNSFVRNYLVDELGISETRLVPLNLPEDYEKALNDGPSNGGVAAVVDERPYIELFLSTRCQFSIVGQQFTKNGWGFAFPRDSPLAVDISSTILKLSENGELQRIHDKWLTRSACSSQGAKTAVDRLELKSFKGLFFICGLACCIALFIYLGLTIHQYAKHKPDLLEPSTRSLKPGRLKTFISFVDEKHESVKARTQKRLEEARSRASLDGNDLSVNGSRSSRRVSVSDTP
ncbi:putative periplasmic binding protein-like I [Helianthus annuus]|nr:putative periplasmic binding protein-like I [Helianthus annuus]